MKIKEVTDYLESKYPLWIQEDFDNCGMQCGDKEREVNHVLVCFEVALDVVDEAIALGANLIISHHPLLLRNGLKKIEPTSREGVILFKALENQIAIYSMHTNMDSAIGGGNDVFAQKLGLLQCRVIAPKEECLQKLTVFVPQQYADSVKEALFAVGCGTIGNYDRCSYSCDGVGTFRPSNAAHPFIGNANLNETVKEERIEMLFPAVLQRKIITTIYQVHPYEEPAFDIVRIENLYKNAGLGRIGKLPYKMEIPQFLGYVKEKMEVNHIRYSGDLNHDIKTVAVCGGGGSSLINNAIAMGADAYVTGDIKYHDFFIPDNKMLIADIGHFEGEHFIREIIYGELKENFCNFATTLSVKESLKIFHF
ncbi:MAG: Nif3-like dinuclear metal center hexameric protein [Bacteroidales bacterium]|jgi:dinuclear metal center YbgI/SA1388 family protein|nr:Nif3-like dinuclear metal center hexameric protein [Bacteroidales bacterium]